MADENSPFKTSAYLCILRVTLAAGVAFLSLANAVDNLVKYLFGPGAFWIVGGTFVAAYWAFEAFCLEE